MVMKLPEPEGEGPNVPEGQPFLAGKYWYVRVGGHLYGPFSTREWAQQMATSLQTAQAAGRAPTPFSTPTAAASGSAAPSSTPATSAAAPPPARAQAPARASAPAAPSQAVQPESAPPQVDQFGNPLTTTGPLGVQLVLHTYSPNGVPIYQDPSTLRRYAYLPNAEGDLAQGRWVEVPVVVVPGEVPATPQAVQDAVNPPEGPRDVAPDQGQVQDQNQSQNQAQSQGLPPPLPGMTIVYGFAGPVGTVPNPEAPGGFDYYVAVGDQWVKMAGPPNPLPPPSPEPPPVSPAVSKEWQEFMRKNPEWARMAIGGGRQGQPQPMAAGGTVSPVRAPRQLAPHEVRAMMPVPLQFRMPAPGVALAHGGTVPPPPPSRQGGANAIVGEGKTREGYRRELVLTPQALASGGVYQAKRPTTAALPPGSVVVPVHETAPANAALDRTVPELPSSPPPPPPPPLRRAQTPTLRRSETPIPPPPPRRAERRKR